MTAGVMNKSISALYFIFAFSLGLGNANAGPLEEADFQIGNGNYVAAISILNEAAAADPGNGEIWRLLGYAYRLADSLTAACSAYEKVLFLNPDDYDAHLALGLLYSWRNLFEKANAMYDYLLAVDSLDAEALIGKGRISAWQGRFADAENYYNRALSIRVDLIGALVGLGWVYTWSERYPQAISAFEKVLAIDSSNGDALEGLAKVRLWSDQPYRAAKTLAVVSKTMPENKPLRLLADEIALQTDFRLDNSMAFVSEYDGGRVTEYNRVDEVISRRLSDRVSAEAGLSGLWTFRRDAYVQRRTVSLKSRLKVSRRTTLSASAGVELLRSDFDRTSLALDLESFTPLRSFALILGRGLYEPWSDIDATSVSGEFRTYEWLRLSFAASGGVWWLSDENRRAIASANLKSRILVNPSFDIGYRFRQWDYKFKSTYYYSPIDLNQHELGFDFAWQSAGKIGINGDGYYTINSDEVKAYSGSANLMLNLGRRSWLTVSLSGYRNNFDYRVGTISGKLRINL